MLDNTANDAPVDKVGYNAWGQILSQSGSTYLGRYGFDSYDTDAATGLDLVNARVYDPELQQWTTQDPMGFAAGDSNLRRYVNNSPVNGLDPSGLAEVPDIQPGTNSVLGRKSSFGQLQNQKDIKAQMDYTTTLLERLQTYTMLTPPVLPVQYKDSQDAKITVKSNLEITKQRNTYGWYIIDFNRPKIKAQGGDEVTTKTVNEVSTQITRGRNGQITIGPPVPVFGLLLGRNRQISTTNKTSVETTTKRVISSDFYQYREYEARLTVRTDIMVKGENTWRYYSYVFLPTVENVVFVIKKK